MNPNKALRERGDFTRIAATMRESGEALVGALGVRSGLRVLDLGCGDGTTALPAAKLGADILGVDIARNLVEAGTRRAKEEGLTNVQFGPTMSAFEAAEKSGHADELAKEVEALFERENTSPEQGKTSIPATFLRVTVTVN